MSFSRQEYWSGLPFPSPGHLPDPGMEPLSPAPLALQADSLLLDRWGSPGYHSKFSEYPSSHIDTKLKKQKNISSI